MQTSDEVPCFKGTMVAAGTPLPASLRLLAPLPSPVPGFKPIAFWVMARNFSDAAYQPYPTQTAA